MEIWSIIITIAGLSVFEIINSVDNAIINANVLSTMHARSRKWFLFAGIFFAVFVVRGLLPWLIIWITVPSIGPIGALTATFSNDPSILGNIEKASPILLIGAATFLLFLFSHWLIVEPKKALLKVERLFQSSLFMFYIFASLLLATIVWFAIKKDPTMAFASVIGAMTFFIVDYVRRFAEADHHMFGQKNLGDIAKIIYLEILDSTFSIDGVTGAFAFTLSVPLIMIGNGIGAFVVRQLTVKNMKMIHKLKFLKKGAMYSISLVALIMLFESFGYQFPAWAAPLVTFLVVGYFFYLSEKDLKKAALA